MTRQKDLKKLTRARMDKTGESYTTARAQLVAKRRLAVVPAARPKPVPPAPATAMVAAAIPAVAPARSATRRAKAVAAPSSVPDYAALAGMSDAAIQAKTGCPWKEWVEALDYQGAEEWSHRAIATWVASKLEIPGWWAQAVAVGYERIKGLRAIGQQRSGEWEANRSKTFAVPVAELYRACVDGRARRKWLGESDLVMRKGVPDRSLRFKWPDGSPIELWFTAKGPAKSSVSVQHRKLPSQAAADERKAYWGERLDALAKHLATAKR